MTTDAQDPRPTNERDGHVGEPETAAGEATAARCFLCDRPFRPGLGESIAGGEGVDLCVSCGSIYVAGCGC